MVIYIFFLINKSQQLNVEESQESKQLPLIYSIVFGKDQKQQDNKEMKDNGSSIFDVKSN